MGFTAVISLTVKSPTKVIDPSESASSPAYLRSLSKVNSAHLTTVQLVIAMETTHVPECPGVTVSMSELDAEVTFKVTAEGQLMMTLSR